MINHVANINNGVEVLNGVFVELKKAAPKCQLIFIEGITGSGKSVIAKAFSDSLESASYFTIDALSDQSKSLPKEIKTDHVIIDEMHYFDTSSTVLVIRQLLQEGKLVVLVTQDASEGLKEYMEEFSFYLDHIPLIKVLPTVKK